MRAFLLGVGSAGFGVSLLLGIPHAAGASSSDVVAGRTGGFGEITCQQCHWENPLNEPTGRLTIEGIPERYTLGEQYLITVTVARPGLGRGGFQLSAREDRINMTGGMNAGTLAPVDKTSQLLASAVTYVQHTRDGSAVAAPGTAKWRVRWTAPENRVNVVFHVAANASNDDASPLGDFIYTASLRTR